MRQGLHLGHRPINFGDKGGAVGRIGSVGRHEAAVIPEGFALGHLEAVPDLFANPAPVADD